MEVFSLKNLDQTFHEKQQERERFIERQLKNFLFVCQKRCFRFDQPEIRSEEAICYNNCSQKLIKSFIPLSKKVYQNALKNKEPV